MNKHPFKSVSKSAKIVFQNILEHSKHSGNFVYLNSIFLKSKESKTDLFLYDNIKKNSMEK